MISIYQFFRGNRPPGLAQHINFHSPYQIKSFLLVYEAVKTTINDQVGRRGYMGRVIWVWGFYVGRCVLREWVVRGGGLDGYFGEQGLPVGGNIGWENFVALF